ncbi:MAG: transcriptional repressor LexA [Thermomicrobiales bacterium]|nr:transcriptional repressor LexA [Thermomicrobiales bacterium]
MKELSDRQTAILDFIDGFLNENDYPPTIRDIQNALGISSTSVVDYNLNVLEQRNYIRRNRNISRGIEVTHRPNRSGIVSVPVIGQIAAGLPIPAPDDMQTADWETIDLSTTLLPNGSGDVFALRVKGLSMIDAHIDDGDIVVLKKQAHCNNGDTVAVWLRDEKETTLKKFFLEGNRVRLQPANSTMEPIYASPENVEVQGKLVTVVRSYN